jgi:hypothetical protein
VTDLYTLYGKADLYVFGNSVGGSLTVILPTIGGIAVVGDIVRVSVLHTALGRITVTDGTRLYTIHSNEGIQFMAGLTEWYVTGIYNSGVGVPASSVRMGQGALMNVNNIENVIMKPIGLAINTNRSVLIGSGTGDQLNGNNDDVVIGYNAGSAGATESQAVAIGVLASQNRLAQNSVSVGYGAMQNVTSTAQLQRCVAIGAFALRTTGATNGVDTIAIGYNAGVAGSSSGCVIIGSSACPTAPSSNSISIGNLVNQSGVAGSQSITIGYNNNCNNTRGICIGSLSTNNVGTDSIILGYNITSSLSRNILIGSNIISPNTGNESCIIQSHSSSVTYPANTVCVGALNSGTSSGIVLLGTSNSCNSSNCVSVGISNTASGSGVIFGRDNITVGTNIVIGVSTQIGSTASPLITSSSSFVGGQSNRLIFASSTANNVVVGVSNTSTLTNFTGSVVIGVSNTTSSTGSTVVGRSNTLNSGDANTVVLGNGNTIAASTTNAVVLGVSSSANNSGVATTGMLVVGTSCTATQSGGGAAAIGVGSTSTGDHSVALGINSRSVGSGFNVSVPQSVRLHTSVSQADAHRRFGAPLTSYTTAAITANGVLTFTISPEFSFGVTAVMVTNVGTGNGSLSISVGDATLATRYLAVTAFTLAANSSTIQQLALTNVATARSTDGLRVTVSLFTAAVAPFVPRVTIMGMLYQIS